MGCVAIARRRRKRYCLMAASLASIVFRSTAPGMRVPSAKKMAGVPWMRSFWPSSRTLSFGDLQVGAAVAGAVRRLHLGALNEPLPDAPS